MEINERFYCLKCGVWALVYKGSGRFHCEACPNVFITPLQKALCPDCRKPHGYYTSFDPAVCPHCKVSFYSLF